MVSDRSGANPLTHQSAFPVSGCKVTPFSLYRHHFICIFDGGRRVPAYETGTLGGGEGFLMGLLFGEWVGGTVNFECKRIAVDGECGASRLMRIWVL